MIALRAFVHRWRYPIVELVTTLLIIGLIWIVLGDKKTYSAVPLTDMLRTFFRVWFSSHFTSDFLPSMKRLSIGYAIAVVAGLVIGFALGLLRPLRLACQPVVAFMRAIPPVALIPLALVILGLGDTMKISIISFVCIWPIVLNVIDGLAELDATMLATVRSYRIGPFNRIFRVLLPAVSPRALAGMRNSLSLAVLLLVASEIEASSGGIGYFLFQAQEGFRVADMWAAIILLGLLGYVLNMLFSVFERWVLRWQVTSTTEV